MPLSNDFTNTRLSYLQDAIKNTKVVAKQFYPRFVREYNEQFPFTEPKLSSIGNPIGNTAIRGYLKKPSDEQVIENLTTKINSLTNDENITKYIVDALGEQLSISALKYYDENFNTIQKQISISRDGIGKDAFIDKVLETLRNDPHTKNLSIYDSTPYLIRPDDPVKVETPDIFSHMNEDQLIDLEDTLTPMKQKEPMIPFDLHDLFIPKQPYLRDTVKLPDAIKLPKKGKTVRLAETLEESLPVLQRKSVLPLAESLSLLQRKSILQLPQAIPVAEQVAEKNSNEKLPFLEELKAVDGKPVKPRGRMAGIPNHDNRIENPTDEQLIGEIVKRLKMKREDITEEFLNRYKTAYLKPDPKKSSTTSQAITRSKAKSKNLSLGVSSGSIVLNTSPPPKKVKIIDKTKQFAKGIQLKPLRIQNRIIKHKQVFNNNKYAIDTKKLKKNILDLKYVKNANHVATFQPIEISDKLRYIIDNIIKDFYNVQNEDFNNLNTTEKRILKRLFTFLNIQNNTLNESSYSDKNDSIQHNFEVAYGSFLAGNDNKELINELIQYVKLALHENTISKKDGYEILKKLNNK
jgi:hypothetical protein